MIYEAILIILQLVLLKKKVVDEVYGYLAWKRDVTLICETKYNLCANVRGNCCSAGKIEKRTLESGQSGSHEGILI